MGSKGRVAADVWKLQQRSYRTAGAIYVPAHARRAEEDLGSLSGKRQDRVQSVQLASQAQRPDDGDVERHRAFAGLCDFSLRRAVMISMMSKGVGPRLLCL